MASRPSNHQGWRDAAVTLPAVATLLLMPPLIRIFATPAMPGGIPLIVLYIFGVWAGIILVAFLLSRRWKQPADAAEDAPEADAG